MRRRGERDSSRRNTNKTLPNAVDVAPVPRRQISLSRKKVRSTGHRRLRIMRLAYATAASSRSYVECTTHCGQSPGPQRVSPGQGNRAERRQYSSYFQREEFAHIRQCEYDCAGIGHGGARARQAVMS